jgi:hypothetical protein
MRSLDIGLTSGVQFAAPSLEEVLAMDIRRTTLFETSRSALALRALAAAQPHRINLMRRNDLSRGDRTGRVPLASSADGHERDRNAWVP